jgi:nucleotide-binding universal stress UspA family protein
MIFVEERDMQKILVAVDGSECSDRAVSYALHLAESDASTEMHLLNVQPAIRSGDVRMFVSREMIENYQREEGDKALASAKRMLANNGIPYKAHIAPGNPPEVIADFTKELKCDAIIMGTRGLGSISGMVLGSVATKVLHLVDVPVTIVK